MSNSNVILVTGGAGYIGSHAVKRLLADGHRPFVVDNLFRGHRAAVPDGVPFFELDLRRTAELAGVLREHDIECVMHFAALAYVGESVQQPLRYYENNTGGSLSLLQAMADTGVKRMVFSSGKRLEGWKTWGSSCRPWASTPPRGLVCSASAKWVS